MSGVVIIDAGGANLGSVRAAFARLGVEPEVSRDPARIAAASKLVLPGVGAAAPVMRILRETGIDAVLRASTTPLLGICIGMQVLFERSEEGAGGDPLGFIPGAVTRLDPGPALPVPHMGWSRLTRDRDDPLLKGVADGAYAYFVHGFVCPDGPATLARADYGGPVPAMVRSANRWGCQFHPERSAAAGARILKNFLELPA